MVKRDSSTEEHWDRVFEASVKLSRRLQEERQILEERVKHLNAEIYKMTMEKKVDFAKQELLLCLKEKETLNYKCSREEVIDELSDFREWFDYLCQKQSELKDSSKDVTPKGGQQEKQLADEVKRLKSEIEKYKAEKNSEISALLAEKNFVWNQLKTMERDYDKQLRNKSIEIDRANEKIQILVVRAEELQFVNDKLKSDFARTESDSFQKGEKISRLLKEIATTKSKFNSTSPTLRSCRTGLVASQMGSKTGNNGRSVTVKKESDHVNASEKKACTKQIVRKSTGGKAQRKCLSSKERSRSKGKAVDVITIIDSPKLFTSSFKVPKLKSTSSSPAV